MESQSAVMACSDPSRGRHPERRTLPPIPQQKQSGASQKYRMTSLRIGNEAIGRRLPATAAIVCVMSLASMAFGEAQAVEKVTGKLSTGDALTMPGRPVLMEARLVSDGLLKQSGIGGELIEFFVRGKKIGAAMTGGDGRARFEYTPRMRGSEPVTVRQAESARVQASEATATLFVWERRRPILLVESGTLIEPAEVPLAPIPLPASKVGTLSSPAPQQHAVEELRRLTEYFFNVVYVFRAGLQNIGPDDFHKWIRQHEFPSGLLVVTKPGKEAIAALIEDLKKQGWDNVKSGVGRTKEFVEALGEHRIEAVMVPEPDHGEVPKKVFVAKGWKDVRRKLQG